MPDARNGRDVPATSALGCLLRVFWMLGGIAILLYSSLWIALESDSARLSAVDVVFGVGLSATILARYLDLRFYSGTTGTGEPATMADWRRYAALLAVTGIAAWGVAHGVAWLRTG
jgi:hypothetical protein